MKISIQNLILFISITFLTAAPVYARQAKQSGSNSVNRDGHQFVDLRLPSGLKWASCNIGAEEPEAYGAFFAWGETRSKSSFAKDNSETFCNDIDWLHSNGYIDAAGNLTPDHDAARQNWGGSWRMPTKADFDELIANTTAEWTSRNGVKGCILKSKRNGNSIFLPAAGFWGEDSLNFAEEFGYFWGATADENDPRSACRLLFYPSDLEWSMDYRNFGYPIRPVTP